jgi:hypothetical protein
MKTHARIIGYVGGRPVREIRGGSVDTPEQPPQGQQQQGDPNDGLPDLLGEPADGGDGGGGDPPAGGEAAPAWWGAAAASLQETIAQQTQSEIDRRINQLQRRNGQAPQGQQGGQQQQQPAQIAPQGTSQADIREARAAYRDAWTDTGIRLSAEEREFVSASLGGYITAELAQDSDPDRAGTRVAGTVAAAVKKLRSSYQTRVVQRLEQAGALDRSKLKAGTPNTGGGSQQSPVPDWKAGQDMAHKLLSNRGMIPPDQTKS